MRKYLSFICLTKTTFYVLLFLSFNSLASHEKDSLFVSRFFDQSDSKPINDSIKKSIEVFKSKVPKNQFDLYLYRYSKYLLINGQIKESEKLAEEGIKLFQSDSDNIKSIKFYNLKAAVFSMQKEYVKAIGLFNKSIAISEKNKSFKQAAYLQNNVANIFFSLQDYNSAYLFAKKAFKNLNNDKKDPYFNQILSVLSVAEAKIGNYSSAKGHAEMAFENGSNANDKVAIIIAQYALGDIALIQKNFKDAKNYFSNSLLLSDSLRQYHFSMLNCIGLAVSLNELKEYQAAIVSGEKGIALANALQNSNTIYSLKKNLALSYAELGADKKSYDLLLEAHTIYKETTNADRQKDINDILIKYDTEKKEKELAKKDIELLEKNVEARKFYQTITVLSFGLILLTIFFFIQRMKNRNKQQRLTIENERNVLNAIIQGEEEERTRFANELHDGLASSLTAAKFKLEALDVSNNLEKTNLVELLRNTHEETRRIAHNLSPLILEKNGLFQSLDYFCKENSNEQTKVVFSGSGEEANISKSSSLICYRITQELVQNALKHAESSKISVNFLSSKNDLNILIEDNGIGFEMEIVKQNNGLLSCVQRIESLKGTIEFDSSIGQGTVIVIQIPS